MTVRLLSSSSRADRRSLSDHHQLMEIMHPAAVITLAMNCDRQLSWSVGPRRSLQILVKCQKVET